MDTTTDNKSKKRFIFYRILGSILNCIAIFFLLNTVVGFFAFGFQPMILLMLFIVISILIYSNLSILFGRYVLRDGVMLNIRVKDWLMVNSIVTLIGSGALVLVILGSVANWNITKSLAVQNQFPVTYFEYALAFLFSVALLFILHVLMTWKHLKVFKTHFRSSPN